MAILDFMPTNDSDLRTWATNLKSQLPNMAQTLNIDAISLQNAINILDSYIAAYDDAKQKDDALKAAIALKNDIRKHQFLVLRSMIGIWKRQQTYTDSIGQSLGIVGTNIIIDWDTLKPTLKAVKLANFVKITFTKQKTDGINIYSRRGNETEYTFLARDTNSPYEDTRANLSNASGERREYYAAYIKNDIEIGLHSDIVVITV